MRAPATRLLLTTLLITSASTAHAQSVQLPFEGFLTGADDMPISGMIDIEVRIWDTSTGGVALFEETHAGLMAIGGFFSVQIGSVTPLDPTIFQSGGDRYLGITIIGDSDELAPRFQIGFVPYAIHALSADTSGPTGPTGPQGPIGETGPTGPTGADGAHFL